MSTNQITVESIEAMMARRGWSQYRLADELGITQASVSRLLNGKNPPSGPVQKLLEQMMSEEKR